jgi:hypothetical protein
VWFAGKPAITPVAELAINFIAEGELMELKYAAIAAQVSQSESLLKAVGKDFFIEFTGAETYRYP